jgi:RimJ/RimL family protein N-acetyltransferase
MRLPTMSRPPFPPGIATARLTLRPPTVADAPTILAAVTASYAELNEWMDWARGRYELADAESFCADAEESLADGREYPVLLTHHGDDHVIGSMGLIDIDWTVPKFEIGYWIDSRHVGRGYCTEAARALTRLAFEELSAKRVQIMMDTRNKRSWAVAERLGFELEAVHRDSRRDNAGRLSDTRMYAMFDVANLR